MTIKDLGTNMDRQWRIDLNDNFRELSGMQGSVNDAVNKAKTAEQIAKTAEQIANEAEMKADTANDTSNSVQEQLDTIVINGDSSVEAAQARVDLDNRVYQNLKERVDAEQNKIKGIAKFNINLFPRTEGETQDIPRINRGITYINSLGGGELVFNAEEYLLIPQKPEPGDTTLQSNTKRIRLKNNVSLSGKMGYTIFKVSDNNPNYHCIVEEEKPNVQPIKNVMIKGITFDHNVYNNTEKPDTSLNNQKECFRIYKSENLTIKDCKFLCNSINGLNFRIGLQYIQEELNNGIYPNKNLIIENNDITFISLDIDYFDNTFITLIGENSIVKNNRISSIKSSTTQLNGENTAVEINGKNIECFGNVISNYLLGIDILSVDTYTGDRNIRLFDNKIVDCARGVKLWSLANTHTLADVKIFKNSIILNQLLHRYRQESSTRCGIGIANHATGSLGAFKKIQIQDNEIIMGDSTRDYLLTLPYPGSYYLGLEFDATFNGMYFGGTGSLLDNFTIKNNEFKNLSCPAMFFGHTTAKRFTVGDNWFVNCGYGKRSAVLAFNRYMENFTISNNNFVDTGYPTMNGNKMYSFASSTSGAIYKNVVIGSNKELIRSGEYQIDRGDLFHTIIFDTLSNFLENYSSVVKNGLTLSNSIANGNFGSGITNWSSTTATIGASNGTLSVSGNGTAAYVRVVQSTGIPCVTGKKVFVKCRVRVTNDLCSSIQFVIAGSSSGSVSTTVQSSPLANQWYDIWGVLTIPSTVTGNVNLYVSSVYADITTANGKVTEIQNVLSIDLTNIYGVGNEPLANRMVSIINEYFNGWFDSTKGIGGLNKTGNTSNRPNNVSSGFNYFDVTLNKPIWRNSTNTGWVDASGLNV
ncbi:alanine-zipper protein [Bacillus toyonensis]|uniref:alanine-zipper protein n=1 Tax=Bacillus toyonensis TaxID=155322 RepID=UPI003807E282